MPPEVRMQTAPTQWQAPLPHAGQQTDLARWWRQFDDPLLAELLEAAQQVSPSVAAARSRIAQARANRAAARSALLPQLGASVSATRGRQDISLPVATTETAGLQAQWELDVFGAGSKNARAADSRLEGAQAGWHEARVAVAAEVATAYVGLRACEARLVATQADATSRGETSRLTELSTRAGFEAPATAALARAGAAQSNSLFVAQRTQCDNAVKGLVALTDIDEPRLRSRLAARQATLPQPAPLSLSAVPWEVLNQRPDLYIALRDVHAASNEVSQAWAARLPRVTLAGSIGQVRVTTGAGTTSGSTWAIGPVAITLPLFDAGARRANVDAAQARYDESILAYRAKVRGAVSEVEQALLQLHSTDARRDDAHTAAEGFDTSFKAVEARYKGGLASLFELEDARRNALQSQIALVELERERVTAWITLYRALGGGWTPGASASADSPVVSPAAASAAASAPPSATAPR
ncbi:MAG: hypothetical protein RLZZ618_1935 [Pseudomonadota bacterium]|jgi:NodT family efflux transporter outer membrane factor (OMF) lipoprotein